MGRIPQAKHGASGVQGFATAGSKLEGTGFEREQIGHIHVAVLDRAIFDADEEGGNGLDDLGLGEAVELRGNGSTACKDNGVAA